MGQKFSQIFDESKFLKIKKVFLPRLLKNVSGSNPKMSLYHISKSNNKKREFNVWNKI